MGSELPPSAPATEMSAQFMYISQAPLTLGTHEKAIQWIHRDGRKLIGYFDTTNVNDVNTEGAHRFTFSGHRGGQHHLGSIQCTVDNVDNFGERFIVSRIPKGTMSAIMTGRAVHCAECERFKDEGIYLEEGSTQRSIVMVSPTENAFPSRTVVSAVRPWHTSG